MIGELLPVLLGSSYKSGSFLVGGRISHCPQGDES
jgi:hypothetical protein